MGAGQSSMLAIATDRPFYFDGDEVAGVVALELAAPLDAGGVFLELAAAERTYFTTTGDTTHDDERMGAAADVHRGEAVFLRADTALAPPSTRLEAGRHQFPFRLALPAGLPPTASARRGGDVGEVAYTLRTRVATGVLHLDLKAEAQLAVRGHAGAPGAPPPPAAVAAAEGAAVSKLCCLGAGAASVSAALPAALVAGAPAPVDVSLANSSSEGFSRVDVTLRRRVTIYSHDRFHRATWTTKCVASAAAPGAPPGATASARVALAVPADAPPSVAGRLVEISYTVEVAAVANGLLTRGVHAATPVAVVAAPAPLAAGGPAATSLAAPPPGWGPARSFDEKKVEVALAPPPAAPAAVFLPAAKV